MHFLEQCLKLQKSIYFRNPIHKLKKKKKNCCSGKADCHYKLTKCRGDKNDNICILTEITGAGGRDDAY